MCSFHTAILQAQASITPCRHAVLEKSCRSSERVQCVSRRSVLVSRRPGLWCWQQTQTVCTYSDLTRLQFILNPSFMNINETTLTCSRSFLVYLVLRVKKPSLSSVFRILCKCVCRGGMFVSERISSQHTALCVTLTALHFLLRLPVHSISLLRKRENGSVTPTPKTSSWVEKRPSEPQS